MTSTPEEMEIVPVDAVVSSNAPVQTAKGAPKQVVVDDAHPFDLDAYLSAYSGTSLKVSPLTVEPSSFCVKDGRRTRAQCSSGRIALPWRHRHTWLHSSSSNKALIFEHTAERSLHTIPYLEFNNFRKINIGWTRRPPRTSRRRSG